MMRIFFDRELDSVATFWRVYRCDGVTLGFVSHDRDIAFGGLLHRSAPGMKPAAIRLTSDLSDDSAEVEGSLSHETIRQKDLAAGLFDEASIEIGAVDWETLEHQTLYSGRIGRIEEDGNSFAAELRSAKQLLEIDLVPRTSPTCRAVFCGPGCGLPARKYETLDSLTQFDSDLNRIQVAGASGPGFVDGCVRFLGGPQTGVVFHVVGVDGSWLVLDRSLVDGTEIGTLVEVLEGCDHTYETCRTRFANTVNFRGEPFLPGNDLLARYGKGGG